MQQKNGVHANNTLSGSVDGDIDDTELSVAQEQRSELPLSYWGVE